MLENLRIALRKQRKLVLIFFLTIFLPALTLGVFGVRAIRNERFRLARQEENEARRAARFVRAHFQSKLEAVAHALEKEIHRTSRGAGIFWSALSPDGRHLALRAEDKIRVLSQDGTESRDLVDAKFVSTLAWTGDGKNLLYGKTEEGNQEVVEIWRIPAAGGEPQKVGLAMSRLMHLRVSPDGKSIAFTASEQPGRTEVWVMENFLGSVKK